MNKDNRFSSILIDWYNNNKRILPWRGTRNPYKIWISEIILQQTRVVQGLNYYNRFLERFPDVNSLAEAEEQEVLKYWQGLGYYSRARNLHFTAKTIVHQYSGNFPKDYHSLLQLKGIGEYTAAAIASFAWNLPYPVVDGNVFRFLSRIFRIDEPIDTNKGKKLFFSLADDLMDKEKAGIFNQAIMEFGALHCSPTNPNCAECPFDARCLALASRSVEQYPKKQGKSKTKDLFLYYFHIHDDENLFLKQRKGKGIWQNLFEFPLIESETPLSFEQISVHPDIKNWLGKEDAFRFTKKIENKKHVLSHRILFATFYEITINKKIKTPEGFIEVKLSDIHQYPVHRLMEGYLEKFSIPQNNI